MDSDVILPRMRGKRYPNFGLVKSPLNGEFLLGCPASPKPFLFWEENPENRDDKPL